MDPTCVSAAEVLRCLSLTRGQNIAFIVPVAMEFMASCLLIFFKWGSGKQHLLLVAEGWIYFILALIELCSVIPSLSKDNANLFRSFDIGIGIVSFLPLGLYTIYLYLITRRKLLGNLPNYVIKVAQVSMFLALPLAFGANELASVSKIKINFDSTGAIPSFAFVDQQVEWICLFFTALTLAVLTAYQATIFCLAFFRLIWILVQRRRGHEGIRVGGIGWVSAGVNLGALEAIIGFAGGRFEVSMIRRIMRFAGRACLCIGAIIGVDAITEPYNNLNRQKPKSPKHRQTHRSLRMMISDPRFSTFQELSPMATGFHAAHQVPPVSRPLQRSSTTRRGPHYLPYSQRPREAPRPNRFPSVKDDPNQRVTVLYDASGGPPLLQMRFSVLGVPLAAASTPTLESEPEKEWNKLRFPEPTKPLQLPVKNAPPMEANHVLVSPNPPFAQEGKNRSNRVSASSIVSSIVEIIDVPRRTISQRLAEARLYRARTRDQVEDQESKGTSPSTGGVSDSDSPDSPGQLFSLSRLAQNSSSNLAYMRNDTHSLSIKSISDSIEAVQELASQFPTLPSTPSLDLFLEYVTPACGEMTCTSGQFVFAIGSPSDLDAASQMRDSVTEVSADDSASCRSLLSPNDGQFGEEDIARTPRPSSCHTSATIRQSVALDPLSPDTAPRGISPGQVQQQPQPVSSSFGINPFVPIPFGDAMDSSEWANGTANRRAAAAATVHDRAPPAPPPQSVDNINNSRGGLSVYSRVAGPRTMANPTMSASNRASSLKGRVGSQMKPIVVPRRRSNLPKAIQWSEDGVPLAS